MKIVLSLLAAIMTLALRHEANHGFLSLLRYMHPGWLNGIDYNLAYVLPYVLLFLATIDNLRLLHENKAMVATRMPSLKAYKAMEGRMLASDCFIAIIVYHAVLLLCTKWEMGWDVLEVIAQGFLIVFLSAEVFSLMQDFGNELAFAMAIGILSLACFAGMLATYRTGVIMEWNLMTYNVMLGQTYQGNGKTVAVYACIAGGLEWIRRRK